MQTITFTKTNNIDYSSRIEEKQVFIAKLNNALAKNQDLLEVHGFRDYVTVKDDTIPKIAATFGVTIALLTGWNTSIPDPIPPGTVLRIRKKNTFFSGPRPTPLLDRFVTNIEESYKQNINRKVLTDMLDEAKRDIIALEKPPPTIPTVVKTLTIVQHHGVVRPRQYPTSPNDYCWEIRNAYQPWSQVGESGDLEIYLGETGGLVRLCYSKDNDYLISNTINVKSIIRSMAASAKRKSYTFKGDEYEFKTRCQSVAGRILRLTEPKRGGLAPANRFSMRIFQDRVSRLPEHLDMSVEDILDLCQQDDVTPTYVKMVQFCEPTIYLNPEARRVQLKRIAAGDDIILRLGDSTSLEAGQQDVEAARLEAEARQQDLEAARLEAEARQQDLETARLEAEARQQDLEAEALQQDLETARLEAETTARLEAEAQQQLLDIETARLEAEASVKAATRSVVAAKEEKLRLEALEKIREEDFIQDEDDDVTDDSSEDDDDFSDDALRNDVVAAQLKAQLEAENLEQLEAEKLEAQLKAEKLKAEKLEAQLEAQLKADQLEQLKAEKLEAEKLEAQLKAEKLKAKKLEAQLKADQLEQLEAEKLGIAPQKEGEQKSEAFRQLSKDDIVKITETFNLFDTDNNNVLSNQELLAIYPRAQKDMAMEKFREYDKNDDGEINLDEFVEWCRTTGAIASWKYKGIKLKVPKTVPDDQWYKVTNSAKGNTAENRYTPADRGLTKPLLKELLKLNGVVVEGKTTVNSLQQILRETIKNLEDIAKTNGETDGGTLGGSGMDEEILSALYSNNTVPGDITNMLANMSEDWASSDDELNFAEESEGDLVDEISKDGSSGLDFAESSSLETDSDLEFAESSEISKSSGLEFAESSAVETDSGKEASSGLGWADSSDYD